MGKKYQRRVSGLVRSHLTTLLQRKASDPRLQMVTITEVSVTPDTRYADVHYSILGGPEEQAEVQAGLENAAGWLRRELGRRLRLQHTPALKFHYDPSIERGEHIANILDELQYNTEDESLGELGENEGNETDTQFEL
ncbi:MAG TPA: 30S ribosome-binding factor RbfA [Chloroflexi bacterium]|nr:30S ribosome-binding factor RbfA [Chloroflexota bacterium]